MMNVAFKLDGAYQDRGGTMVLRIASDLMLPDCPVSPPRGYVALITEFTPHSGPCSSDEPPRPPTLTVERTLAVLLPSAARAMASAMLAAATEVQNERAS